jgi:hypothetical protein
MITMNEKKKKKYLYSNWWNLASQGPNTWIIIIIHRKVWKSIKISTRSYFQPHHLWWGWNLRRRWGKKIPAGEAGKSPFTQKLCMGSSKNYKFLMIYCISILLCSTIDLNVQYAMSLLCIGIIIVCPWLFLSLMCDHFWDISINPSFLKKISNSFAL